MYFVEGNELLSEIKVSEGNSQFIIENKVLMNKDKTEIILYPFGDYEVLTYTIPKEIETIRKGALSTCFYLQSIEVDVENQYFQSIDGVLFDKEGKILIQ